MVLCIILGLLLTGWAVKTYRTAHPPAQAAETVTTVTCTKSVSKKHWPRSRPRTRATTAMPTCSSARRWITPRRRSARTPAAASATSPARNCWTASASLPWQQFGPMTMTRARGMGRAPLRGLRRDRLQHGRDRPAGQDRARTAGRTSRTATTSTRPSASRSCPSKQTAQAPRPSPRSRRGHVLAARPVRHAPSDHIRPSQPTPSPPSRPGVNLTTLDNGLTIIVREDHSAPVVSAQAWCMAGSIHEGKWLGAGLVARARTHALQRHHHPPRQPH